MYYASSHTNYTERSVVLTKRAPTHVLERKKLRLPGRPVFLKKAIWQPSSLGKSVE